MSNVIAFVILAGLIGVAIRLLGSKQREATQAVRREFEKGIQLRSLADTVEDDEGGRLPVHRILATGCVAVPHDNFAVSFRTRLFDVSDSSEEPYPVFCGLAECTEENGFFEVRNDTPMPYQLSRFEDLPACVLPSFALHLARRGQRKVVVQVEIVPAGQHGPVLSAGQVTLFLTQVHHGYTEGAVRNFEHDRVLARLALALCASDGDIDPQEVATIRRFFGERMAGRENAQEYRTRLEECIAQSTQELSQGSASAAIESDCRQIIGFDEAQLAQTAYELCVQVVAADDKVEDSEQAALQDVAGRLGLAADLVKEIHERHLRLSMFARDAADRLIDMPSGLSDEEKIQFLNQEYRKWRGRVTHSDEKVRTEATMRLDLITKLRKQLNERVPAHA